MIIIPVVIPEIKMNKIPVVIPEVKMNKIPVVNKYIIYIIINVLYI